MDDERFDAAVRALGSGATRRGVLGVLAGIAGLGLGEVAGKGRSSRRGRAGSRVRGEQVLNCTDRGCVNCAGKKIGPGVNLTRCNLNRRIDLAGSNLGGSNLTKACLGDSDLRNVSFRGAQLQDTCFCGSDLRGADFRGSNVTAAQLACARVGCDTILPNGKKAVVCAPGETCCNGACVNTATDPLNCGACGTHCQINGICDQGQCACVLGCNDYRFGFQCCPADSPTASCSCGLTKYTDPLNCDVDIPEEDCPPAQRCIGPFCKACCPPGSTCDPSTGTCLQ